MKITDYKVTVLPDDWVEPPPGPDDIELFINGNGGQPMRLCPNEHGTIQDILKDIGQYLCPCCGVTQQNLATVYREHRKDISYTRQKQ